MAVEAATIVSEVSLALEIVAGRIADLLSPLGDARAAIPGSEWTVREAAAHLANCSAIHAEMANGVPSPVQAPLGDGLLYRRAAAAYGAQRLADVPETDPRRLARLLLDAAEHLIDTTCGRPDEQPVAFHCNLPFTAAGLLCASLSEHLIHGYDIATAIGSPWRIDPGYARLALCGTAPLLALLINQETTRGITLSYEVRLGNAGGWRIGFVDGEFLGETADSHPVDCIIAAEPVAYLLIDGGRLARPPAVALGLLASSGPRAELAARLPDLFVPPRADTQPHGVGVAPAD